MPGGVFVLAHDAGEGVELQDCWPAEAAWSVLGEVLLPAEGPAAYSRWRIMHQMRGDFFCHVAGSDRFRSLPRPLQAQVLTSAVPRACCNGRQT